MSEIDISSLTNTQKTAISMLCTVATEYERKDPLFKDEKAIEVKKNLVDLDFKAHLNQYSLASRFDDQICPVRCHWSDQKVINFLENNPRGILVEFGCGLDCRYYRLKGSINYLNNKFIMIDLPESIDLRAKLFNEKIFPDQNLRTETGDFRNLTVLKASALDCQNWFQILKDHFLEEKILTKVNTPIMFADMGCFLYCEEQAVKNVFKFVADNFYQAEFLCGSATDEIIARGKNLGTQLNWSFTHPQNENVFDFLEPDLQSREIWKMAEFSKNLRRQRLNDSDYQAWEAHARQLFDYSTVNMPMYHLKFK